MNGRRVNEFELTATQTLLDGPFQAKFNSRVLTKLLKNYRSHPGILELPNKLFYDNELVPCVDVDERASPLSNWEHAPNPGCPLIFCGVEGKDQREGNSPSWFNIHEVERVRHYVTKLLEDETLNECDIGIIAPYAKQVQKIKQMLARLAVPGRKPAEIVVGSVEQFQGEEKRVIIITTVRASEEYVSTYDVEYNIGFLSDTKRFNVAITRAKELLITVGHPRVLWSDTNWRKFLQLCRSKKALDGVAPPTKDYVKPTHAGGGGGEGEEGADPFLEDAMRRMTAGSANMSSVPSVPEGMRGPRRCHICGEDGHVKRDCPRVDVSRPAPHQSARACFLCGDTGHLQRSCPQNSDGPNRVGGGGGGGGTTRPGDWKCQGCNFHNFASRAQCLRCKGPKPGGRKGRRRGPRSNTTKPSAQGWQPQPQPQPEAALSPVPDVVITPEKLRRCVICQPVIGVGDNGWLMISWLVVGLGGGSWQGALAMLPAPYQCAGRGAPLRVCARVCVCVCVCVFCWPQHSTWLAGASA